MKKLIFIFMIVSFSFLTGCTVFSPWTKEYPVIEDSVGHVGVIATSAERRVILIDKKDSKFCAEPPPEVAEGNFSITQGNSEC